MAPPTRFNSHTEVNSYTGELTQQSLSGVTPIDQRGMQILPNGSLGIFSQYAVEYQPGLDGYVQWEASGTPAWRLTSAQLAADPVAKISARPVAPEPMYILANLGISQVGSPVLFVLPPATLSCEHHG